MIVYFNAQQQQEKFGKKLFRLSMKSKTLFVSNLTFLFKPIYDQIDFFRYRSTEV
jgi:hypothetical protein